MQTPQDTRNLPDPLRVLPDPTRDSPATLRHHLHAVLDVLTDEAICAYWPLIIATATGPPPARPKT